MNGFLVKRVTVDNDIDLETMLDNSVNTSNNLTKVSNWNEHKQTMQENNDFRGSFKDQMLPLD
jgi:hypothetical protein